MLVSSRKFELLKLLNISFDPTYQLMSQKKGKIKGNPVIKTPINEEIILALNKKARQKDISI